MTDEQSIRDELAEAMICVKSADGRAWFIFGDNEDDRADTLVLADAILASPVIRRIQAEALETAQAELRQERERARGLLAANESLVDAVYATDDDLARARELILQAVKLYDSKPPYKPGLALEMRQTIRPALDYLDKGEKS